MVKTYAARAGENVINSAFFEEVSQIAHFFTMYALTFTAGVFWGWKGVYIVGGLCIAYAAIHEFWYDPRYENPVTRGSDAMDFTFLALGVVVGAAVHALSMVTHGLH